MNHAITIELEFFLVSILWGAIILLSYDGLRILRRLIKHNGFLLALEDLIFWVATSVFIFSMIYTENNGIIRGFSIMGMAIGMVLYHYLISEWLVTMITKIIEALLSPIRFVLKKLGQFLRFLMAKGKKFSKLFLSQLKKILKSVRMALNKKKEKRLAKKRIRKERRTAKKSKKSKSEKKKKIRKRANKNKKKEQHSKDSFSRGDG
ncbi:MAG: hypothetical protein GX306_04035 [Clostridiales bacterium]|jgi:spore cortex biosynthesis protein YabQ|nr:hypothetical protein [Clostridiales bacterium]